MSSFNIGESTVLGNTSLEIVQNGRTQGFE